MIPHFRQYRREKKESSHTPVYHTDFYFNPYDNLGKDKFSMGRFRRNRGGGFHRKQSSKKKNDSNPKGEENEGGRLSNNNNKNGNPSQSRNTLSEGDRKFLVSYLKEYQEGAFATLRGDSSSSIINRTFLHKKTTGNNLLLLPLGGGGGGGNLDFSLIPLTTNILRSPCLSLPSTLSNKHRKVVHEICIDLGLYHTSVGNEKDGMRYVAVSIYYDGFRTIPGFCDIGGGGGRRRHPTNKELWLQRCSTLRPWILQRRDGQPTPETVTRENRDAIFQLVDQPGDCLRDGIDDMDFEDLEMQDLSQTTPPTYDEKNWLLVDTPEKMKECVEQIENSSPTEIAFDLESHSESKYVQVTCLIQLATSSGHEYVIDPLAPGVWETISLLAPIFASKDIVKIGHSIGGLDVRSLHRDFGIFVVNAFDTYEAARCLGLSRHGLAPVCKHYRLPNCHTYESLKADYQTTDWTKRPLTEPMIRYGRYDVHYLIQLRKLMMRDLAKSQVQEKRLGNVDATSVRDTLREMMKNFDEDEEVFFDATPEVDMSVDDDAASSYEDAVDDGVPDEMKQSLLLTAVELRMNPDLMRAISRSQDRCLDLWTEGSEPPMQNADFQTYLIRCKRDGNEWSSSQIRLYKSLADWRETVATERGCSAELVCPLGFLASVAYKRPTHILGLRRITLDLPGILENIGSLWDDLFLRVRRSRIEDGLDEFESMTQFPSYTELEKSTSGTFSYPFDSTTAWRIVSCTAIVAMMAIFYNTRRPGGVRPRR